jgi:hypothetical protein
MICDWMELFPILCGWMELFLMICGWMELFPMICINAKIITLYENKGDKGDCNSYRGISIHSITGKAFARIILNRLQILAERVLPE